MTSTPAAMTATSAAMTTTSAAMTATTAAAMTSTPTAATATTARFCGGRKCDGANDNARHNECVNYLHVISSMSCLKNPKG
jgi:hypothetical protein